MYTDYGSKFFNYIWQIKFADGTKQKYSDRK